MKITQKTHDISEYLKSDEIIDYDDKSVSRLADTLYEQSEDSLDYIRNVYEYVRDRIPPIRFSGGSLQKKICVSIRKAEPRVSASKAEN